MPVYGTSLSNLTNTAISREIASNYDKVKIVAEHIEAVEAVSTALSNPSLLSTLENAGTLASGILANKVAAEAAEELAEKWASEDTDVIVADGKYSAKHYAEKASSVASIVGQITTLAGLADEIELLGTEEALLDIMEVTAPGVLDNIAIVATPTNIANMDAVADAVGTIDTVVTSVLPHMAEILEVDNKAAQVTIDATQVAADMVAVNADKIAVAADRLQTGLDVVATNADVVTTNADVVTTAADRTQTGLDRIATAADRTSTAADRVQTGLDRVAASSSAMAALASQNAAEGSATEAGVILGQVAGLLDSFDDRYLGAKTVDPTLDNDGEALVIGAIYYNTTDKEVRFYDGAVWDRPEYSASQSAMAADTSRVASEAAKVLSEAAKDIAVAKASEALASATTASAKAAEALASASSAATSATTASSRATFVDELVLGAKASDPAVNNTGGVLQVGSVYFNTSTNAMRVWSGTEWKTAVFDASNSVVSFNGRDGAVQLADADITTALGFDVGSAIDNHSSLIVDNTASILALAKSNATGSFGATGLTLNMTSTEQTLPFTVRQQSTNIDKFELDTNEVTIKATGNYTFLSTVTFEDAGANGAVGTVTFRVRDAGVTYYTQTTTVEISGSDRDTVPFNSLLVVTSGVPITAYITVSCNITGYRIVGFDSVLASEKAVGELSGLASHTAVTPVGNIAATNVQAAIAELDSEKLAVTVANASNIGRADKYLAAQAIANMIYTSGNLTKIRYNNDTDVDYETLSYTDGNLTSIGHYVASVLVGTTTLTYTNGSLVSVVYA